MMINVKYNEKIIKVPLKKMNTDEIFNYISFDQNIKKEELTIFYDGGLISPLKPSSLIDIGYYPGDDIEIIHSKFKNRYFNITEYNFLQIIPITRYTNAFDIKKQFSTKFFTVPQNIIIKYEAEVLSDGELLFDFNSDEYSPFNIELNNDYNLYYTFFGQFHFVCMPPHSTLSNLKSSISAYTEKNTFSITNHYINSQQLKNYFEQECITEQEIIEKIEIQEIIKKNRLFEFVESKSDNNCEPFKIIIEIFNTLQGKPIKRIRLLKYNSTQIIDVYRMICILEKDLHIERTLFTLYNKDNKKLKVDNIISPNHNNELKLTIEKPFIIKINGKTRFLNYFLPIRGLKKALNFDKHNFGIIANKHFICIHQYECCIFDFMNNSNDEEFASEITLKYSKEPQHQLTLIKLNDKDQKKENEMKFIVPNNLSLEKIFPLYLNQNFESIQINKIESNQIEYFNKEKQIIPIDFINNDNSISTFDIEMNINESRVIDLLKNLYLFKIKKMKSKSDYDMFDVTLNQKKLYFYEKLSNVLYDKNNKITIKGLSYAKRFESKKINIRDNDGNYITIKYDALTTQEIINKVMIKHRKLNNPRLYLDYVEIKMDDIPTLYNRREIFFFLNEVNDDKILYISNGTPIKIQIKLNKIQYSSIQQIAKVMFNLNDDKEVNFNYIDSKLQTIKLPSIFDAGSLPDFSIISIDYEYEKTNQIVFFISNLSKRVKIEISNADLTFNELKPEIQEKLNLNDYSLKSIHFSYYQINLDENKTISYYKINSFITISMDNSLLISIHMKEKTLKKYFSNDETITDVKKLLKNQFHIENDFDLYFENKEKCNNNFKLKNNMNIYMDLNKVNIICEGSIGNHHFDVNEILTISEAIQYITKELQKSNPEINQSKISIFCSNKSEKCYDSIDHSKKLSEFDGQLFAHKIVEEIDFDKIKIINNEDKNISECNTLNWLIKNYISKEVLSNMKNIIIKHNKKIIDENRSIMDILNNTEGQLEIAFKFDQQKPTKTKKSISRFKPKIKNLTNETIQKKEEELKTTNNDNNDDDNDNDDKNKQNSSENEIKDASAIQDLKNEIKTYPLKVKKTKFSISHYAPKIKRIEPDEIPERDLNTETNDIIQNKIEDSLDIINEEDFNESNEKTDDIEIEDDNQAMLNTSIRNYYCIKKILMK